MRTSFTGVGTALITPFTQSGAVDDAAVRRLARRQVDAGVHILVPCGTTGETPTLSADERRRIVEICVEEARGRALVLAGAGGYDTKEVMHAASEMERAGADGILSVTPYYNKPTPEGLYQHYAAIAGATSSASSNAVLVRARHAIASCKATSVRPVPGAPPTTTNRPARATTVGAGTSVTRRPVPAVAAIARTNVAGAASDSTIASTPIERR